MNWIRFDDEQITKVTDFAAIQDNYGGDDLPVYDYTRLTIQEIIDKGLMHRMSWNLQSKINNAYILVYLREDMVEEMLKPPSPPQALIDRITREQADRERAKHDQATKVIVTLVLERDLVRRQPCGFWDTQEEGIEVTVAPYETMKEDASVQLWRYLEANMLKQLPDVEVGGSDKCRGGFSSN